MAWHHFTVDVEDYFHASAFEGVIPRGTWSSLERRVSLGTRTLMEMLARSEVKGTFFTLGWVAARERELVRDLAAAGHEIASHGWDHRRVTHQTRGEFRASVRRSRALLEDLSGQQVRGFRAPSFSIVPGLEWALDVLMEEGYEYDSSLVPLPRRGYGYPGSSPDPWVIRRNGGQLVEIPPTVLHWLGRPVSAAGGAYFRHLPYAMVRTALKRAESRGTAGTFFIHPWELDPTQPRVPAPVLTRLRHYGGIGRTAGRISTLLEEFRFRPMHLTAGAMAG